MLSAFQKELMTKLRRPGADEAENEEAPPDEKPEKEKEEEKLEPSEPPSPSSPLRDAPALDDGLSFACVAVDSPLASDAARHKIQVVRNAKQRRQPPRRARSTDVCEDSPRTPRKLSLSAAASPSEKRNVPSSSSVTKTSPLPSPTRKGDPEAALVLKASSLSSSPAKKEEESLKSPGAAESAFKYSPASAAVDIPSKSATKSPDGVSKSLGSSEKAEILSKSPVKSSAAASKSDLLEKSPRATDTSKSFSSSLKLDISKTPGGGQKSESPKTFTTPSPDAAKSLKSDTTPSPGLKNGTKADLVFKAASSPPKKPETSQEAAKIARPSKLDTAEPREDEKKSPPLTSPKSTAFPAQRRRSTALDLARKFEESSEQPSKASSPAGSPRKFSQPIVSRKSSEMLVDSPARRETAKTSSSISQRASVFREAEKTSPAPALVQEHLELRDKDYVLQNDEEKLIVQ